MNRLPFKLDSTCPGTDARATTIETRRNIIETPLFMPVGTRATVKGVPVGELRATGAEMILANTYHLLLRPGPDVLTKMGGIHPFMGWPGAVLTDSGGYQIFSLGDQLTLSDEGAVFVHPRNGRPIHLTPEKSMAVQQAINSDIMMVLDECVPATAGWSSAMLATERTRRWAERSLQAQRDHPSALFGIIQGACHPDLRRKSVEEICALPFEGFAVGGLAVGEAKTAREDFCELVAKMLPMDKPRYLMGVGTPIDLLEAVHRGIDMFDCIIPTERGQQGIAFTFNGRIRVTRTCYSAADRPLDDHCGCRTCQSHSIAYLHHLFKAGEPLGPLLLSSHNLFFYSRLTRRMRQAILDHAFVPFLREYRERLDRSDGQPNRKTRPKNRSTRLGSFEVHTADAGFSSIRHIDSAELMHSVNPPDEEADRLYVSQSRLAERLTRTGPPLVVWDVGLGAGHNAMGVLRCAESVTANRRLHLVSFETDLDALALSMRHRKRFPHIRHTAPRAILENGRFERNGVRWTLQEGDFRLTCSKAPPPDLVYYDPFSSKTNPSMWRLDCFERVMAASGPAAVLYTYANATSIRAVLLAAGFFVAEGISSGPKESTTVAATRMVYESTPLNWLDRRWLGRFQRSAAPYPRDAALSERARIRKAIIDHPQFGSAGDSIGLTKKRI